MSLVLEKIVKIKRRNQTIDKAQNWDGSNTFLWFDNWHPWGPLLEKFNDRLIYDSGSHSKAKVSSIISDGA